MLTVKSRLVFCQLRYICIKYGADEKASASSEGAVVCSRLPYHDVQRDSV